MSDKAKAVVLLSGGLDSTTTLAICCDSGYEPHALSFRYGQRHKIEVEAAKQVAKAYGVRWHSIVDIDLRTFGGSALTSSSLDVPKDRPLDEMGEGIPVTYVPARNTIFLSYALAAAEVLKAYDIFLGVNALDYSGYPDCRPEFISAYETMANLATREGVEGRKLAIHTPLIMMTKAEIIRKGLSLGVDYGMTSSCYDPGSDGSACGRCDSCLLRKKGFVELGREDPRPYAVA